MALIYEKFIDSKEITFSEVKNIFWQDNKKDAKNSKWPFHLLNQANKQVGKWVIAKIPYELFLNIKLPYHHHGENILVPRKGMRLKEAYSQLKKVEGKYKRTNPLCYSKIQYFSKKKIGTVFLSSVVPAGRDSYGTNLVRKSLIHIDGLHRLLGEMYKLERKKYKSVECVIAIKNG